MAGETTGQYGWTTMDHCQLADYAHAVTPIRDATESVAACVADIEQLQGTFEWFDAVPLGCQRGCTTASSSEFALAVL